MVVIALVEIYHRIHIAAGVVTQTDELSISVHLPPCRYNPKFDLLSI